MYAVIMKNITLSLDDALLEAGRQYAQRHQTTLNALVRDLLVRTVLADRQSASPTEIMTMTSALLKAANLAVFELGMWQSWTGR